MDIESIFAQLTLDEKIFLLAGKDMWWTNALLRVGLPAIKVTDGPNGARGAFENSGPTSACFPVGVALAATWNPELIEKIAEALAEETKAKGAQILLAPTVNIHRSPLAGRNFECYSEDPFLTGVMATAYIKGLQGKGIGACIKHFVCNDSEFERHSMSSQVGERALREIYLRPFKMAIETAKPWAVMSAYNRLNGVYCNESRQLLQEILKEEWEFDGIVISDWFGTYTKDAPCGGLDLEMPGPARWMSPEFVLGALRDGTIGVEHINDKVKRLLRIVDRAGAFTRADESRERSEDRPEHRRLAREAAQEAVVLLKNEGDMLPLVAKSSGSIAVIGDNAKNAQIMGGGSSRVTPHYRISPLEGIISKAGDTKEIRYALGYPIHKALPVLDQSWVRTPDTSSNGLRVDIFDNLDLSGEPVGDWVAERMTISLVNNQLGAISMSGFSIRISGHLIVPADGRYSLSLSGEGSCRLFLDGNLLINDWDRGENVKGERIVEVDLTAQTLYPLKIDTLWEGEDPWRRLRLGCLPPLPEDPIGEAVALAEHSDIAIIVAGLTPEWESEGFDRVDMRLPGRQDELIQRVAAVNPNTIVVINAGSPVEMPWLDAVKSVLLLWYPGQEGGNALADVIFGDVNPSGKLTTTFPVRLQDNPAYLNYPGENGRVNYGEGIFVGYRYYDKKLIKPLFPFGFGLSYTSFAYQSMKLDKRQYCAGDKIQVEVQIQNIGDRSGKEIVQLYIRDIKASLIRPEKELRAFKKVDLSPGEQRIIYFQLSRDDLLFYDDKIEEWVAEPGEFEILVGSSSAHIHLRDSFTWLVEDSLKSDEIGRKRARLHTGLALKIILEDEAGLAVLTKHMQPLLDHPQKEMAMGMSLEQIAEIVPDQISSDLINVINDDLSKIK